MIVIVCFVSRFNDAYIRCKNFSNTSQTSIPEETNPILLYCIIYESSKLTILRFRVSIIVTIKRGGHAKKIIQSVYRRMRHVNCCF